MKKTINEHIKAEIERLEQEYCIKIHYAVESGSRACNNDSDSTKSLPAVEVDVNETQPSQPIAQSDFPDFLQGTWKMESKDIFEHWNKLNDSNLKGFSFELNKGLFSISEYLDISRQEDVILYTAAVLNQNQGRSICFKLTETEPAFVFENPDHDFPQKIVYQKLNDTEVFVRISDGKQKEFSWKMTKQNFPTVPGYAQK